MNRRSCSALQYASSRRDLIGYIYIYIYKVYQPTTLLAVFDVDLDKSSSFFFCCWSAGRQKVKTKNKTNCSHLFASTWKRRPGRVGSQIRKR